MQFINNIFNEDSFVFKAKQKLSHPLRVRDKAKTIILVSGGEVVLQQNTTLNRRPRYLLFLAWKLLFTLSCEYLPRKGLK